MLCRMGSEPSRMQEFMDKRMCIQSLIFKQNGVKSDRHWTWINAQRSTASKFVWPILKTSHAQSFVLIFQPNQGNSILNPRTEYSLCHSRKRLYRCLKQTFGDMRGLFRNRHLAEDEALCILVCHGTGKPSPFMKKAKSLVWNAW